MSVARESMIWVEQIEGYTFEFTDLFARYTEIVGLEIKGVNMAGFKDALAIHFTDGRMLLISDEGQSCCESRYMTCDDDLSGHEGGHLVSVEMDAAAPPRPEPEEETKDEWSYEEHHEEQFVRVQTTKGSFTICTHNIHNGYYGGFDLVMRFEA